MNWLKELKDMPSGFFIGIGLIAIAIAWAINGMSGCEARSIEARYRFQDGFFNSPNEK